MIRYLKHKDIDKVKWDLCIKECINSIIYAQSWYLDVVADNWDALIFGDYEAVMPLPYRIKMGIKYLYVPYYTQQLGLFSIKGSTASIKEMMSSIPDDFKYIDIYLNRGNAFFDSTYQVEERRNQYLDLNLPFDEISKSYSRNVKRNILSAQKSGLIIRTDVAPETIVDLYKSELGEKLKFFKGRDFETLRKLIKYATEKEMAENYGVYTEDGRLLAAGCFFKDGKDLNFFKCSSTAEGKQIGAMHFLVDHFLRIHANSSSVFDFGGSSIPSVARFNNSFGAQEFIYLHVRKNNLPWFLKWLKN